MNLRTCFFILRGASVSAALLLALTLATFVIFFRIPADPANFLLRDPQRATDAERAAARRALGIDQSVALQYLRYLKRLSRGDLGYSWAGAQVGINGQASGIPVRPKIEAAAKVTGSLALGGALCLVILAIPLGLATGAKPRSKLDRFAGATSVLGVSLHPLLLGIGLQIAFTQWLHVLPQRSYCSPFGRSYSSSPDGLSLTSCGGVASWADHLLLPWITFALFFVALYARTTRSRVEELLREPWAQVARAKGMSEPRLLLRHILPNAAPQIISMLAMDLGLAVGLAIYVETVFGLPGLGKLLLDSLQGNEGFDLPVICGIVLTTGTAIILSNLLADLAAAWIDPRLRNSRTLAHRQSRTVHRLS
ncbi:MAG: ABC transporter permease [Actinobacteria bacterium]|nr:ABC transporter permease [Actinomycetota bacterium]